MNASSASPSVNHIKTQSFSKKLFGFNTKQVTDFLNKISFTYNKLLEKNKQLQQKVKELEYKIARFQENEKAVSRVFVIVRDAAKKEKEKATKETQQEIKKMFQEAKYAHDEAIIKYDNLCHDIEDLLVFKSTCLP